MKIINGTYIPRSSDSNKSERSESISIPSHDEKGPDSLSTDGSGKLHNLSAEELRELATSNVLVQNQIAAVISVCVKNMLTSSVVPGHPFLGNERMLKLYDTGLSSILADIAPSVNTMTLADKAGAMSVLSNYKKILFGVKSFVPKVVSILKNRKIVVSDKAVTILIVLRLISGEATFSAMTKECVISKGHDIYKLNLRKLSGLAPGLDVFLNILSIK